MNANSYPPATPLGMVGAEDVKNESNKKTPRSSQRKRTLPPKTPETQTPHSNNSRKKETPRSRNSRKKPKTTKESAEPAIPKRTTRQRVKEDSTPAPPEAEAEAEDTNGILDMSFLDDEKTRG